MSVGWPSSVYSTLNTYYKLGPFFHEEKEKAEAEADHLYLSVFTTFATYDL